MKGVEEVRGFLITFFFFLQMIHNYENLYNLSFVCNGASDLLKGSFSSFVIFNSSSD